MKSQPGVLITVSESWMQLSSIMHIMCTADDATALPKHYLPMH